MSEVLDIEQDPVAAKIELVDAIAGKLTAWHLLDIELVNSQGFMRCGSTKPTGKTGELIRWGLLKHQTDSGIGPILKPTSLFHKVRTAARSGRVKRPEVV